MFTDRSYSRFLLYADDGTVAALAPGSRLTYEEKRERFERFDGDVDDTVLARELRIEAHDVAFLSQVERWRRTGTPVRALVEGSGVQVVWDHPAPLQSEPLDQEMGSFARGISLYTSEPNAAVGEAVNLLAPYGWDGLEALPSVYASTLPSYTIESLAGGVCRFRVEEGAQAGLRALVRAPAPGRRVYATVEIVGGNLDLQTPQDFVEVKVLCLNASGSVIGGSAYPVQDAAPHVYSATTIVPDECVTVGVEVWLKVRPQAPGGERHVEFRTPTLRLDAPGISSV